MLFKLNTPFPFAIIQASYVPTSVKMFKADGSYGTWGGSIANPETNVYTLTPVAADLNVLGPVTFCIADAANAMKDVVICDVVAYDPQNANNLGLVSLPSVAPGVANGLAVVDALVGFVDVNVVRWGGAAISPAVGNLPPVNPSLTQANGIETGITLQGALQLILAAAAGKLAIAGSTVTIRDINDTVDRIVADTDAAGQRLAVLHQP